ncbi:MAG: helix-hairpin-helix domain-containing protein [Candidatus Wallbacteria bacterium]
MKREASKKTVIKKFMTLPGVDAAIAESLYSIGIRSFAEIRRYTPEQLYVNLFAFEDSYINNDILYIFRCIHYYLKNNNPSGELLNWKNWKN